MKTVEMLERLNLRYASTIAIRPAFHWQITPRSAGDLGASIRREPIRPLRIRLAEEFYQRGIDRAMLANARREAGVACHAVAAPFKAVAQR